MAKKIDKQKEEDLSFIRGISKIKVKEACNKYGISNSNIYSGAVNKEDLHKIRRYIEWQIALLYLIKEEEKNEKKS